MNRWYQIRRLRGAAYLILVGVLALLNEWRILSWDKSWPLFLILAGLLALAERAAWTADVREYSAQNMAENATASSSWSTAPAASGAEKPFIQAQPPSPEDFSREDH